MSVKRPTSPSLIPNPFIKRRNLAWTIDDPEVDPKDGPAAQEPTSAAIEAGETEIADHLTYFSERLSQRSPSKDRESWLSVEGYKSLYVANVGSREGAHFVIHQHDHPVAGTHYDLRLQINENSSASWAIMYGLPGDPNSVRLNRNATETRIHCLWNHLVETASTSTGSLIIWDTGTYTVLPRTSKYAPKADPSSPVPSPPSPSDDTQQELLHKAFQNRKIRLQLHGSKLPEPYVLNLRLTKSEDAQGRAKSGRRPKFRRRRGQVKRPAETSSEDEGGVDEDADDAVAAGVDAGPEATSAVERELRELEDDKVRATNAYPGASNTIGSVHQRKWYLSLDRVACGFVKDRGRWVDDTSRHDEDSDEDSASRQGVAQRLSYPFYVHGSETERSVVTGRLGLDVLRDEGVTDFLQRKGWKPVLN